LTWILKLQNLNLKNQARQINVCGLCWLNWYTAWISPLFECFMFLLLKLCYPTSIFSIYGGAKLLIKLTNSQMLHGCRSDLIFEMFDLVHERSKFVFIINNYYFLFLNYNIKINIQKEYWNYKPRLNRYGFHIKGFKCNTMVTTKCSLISIKNISKSEKVIKKPNF
jgi:hypothetical protein